MWVPPIKERKQRGEQRWPWPSSLAKLVGGEGGVEEHEQPSKWNGVGVAKLMVVVTARIVDGGGNVTVLSAEALRACDGFCAGVSRSIN